MKAVGIALAVFLIAVPLFSAAAHAWANDAYTVRYPVLSNVTINGTPIYINGTFGVKNHSIITENVSEPIFLYCSGTDFLGPCFVGNDTAGSPAKTWFNASNITTNNTGVFNSSSARAVYLWEQGEGTRIPDVSDNENTGTLTLNGTSYVDGPFGYAVNTSYTTAGDSATLDMSVANLTIMAWIRPNGFDENQAINTIVEKGGDCGNYHWGVRATTHYLTWLSQADCDFRSGNVAVVVNSWQHVVITLSGNNINYYINNSAAGSAVTTLGGAGAGDLTILRRQVNGAVSNFAIDDVRIYGRVLSADEIRDAFYSGAGPRGNVTLGAEESSGNVAPNYTGNVTSPASPQTYPIAIPTFFNITVSPQDEQISMVWLRHNVTETLANYRMQNDTPSNFFYQLNDSRAGTFTYQFFMNDTNGDQNSTAQLTYTVNQGTTSITVLFNGTAGNATGTFPYITNASMNVSLTNGTLTLLRNGTQVNSSSSVTQIQQVIRLGAGVYNYTANFTHENYTASFVSRYLTIAGASSGMTLTASPSFSVAGGTSVSVTCANTAGLGMTLLRGGANITNPSTSTLGFGNYNFTCYLSDTQNYTPSVLQNTLQVGTGGFACTTPLTYAFRTSISNSTNTLTAINLTGFVGEGRLRADFRDVFLNMTNATGFRNQTGERYYFVVNTTNNTAVQVDFGNYIGNQSWTNITTGIGNDTAYTYSETHPYYVLTLTDEMTGNEMLPPTANTTLSVFCSQGSSTFRVNNTRFTVATVARPTDMRAIVTYSATEEYYRNYIVESDIEYRNLYVVDANLFQVVQILFSLDDRTNVFGPGVQLDVRKSLSGGDTTITEGRFDTESKALGYLVINNLYTLYVLDGTTTVAVGNLDVDAVDLTKTIVVANVNTLNVTGGVPRWNATMDSGTIRFFYYDPTGLTSNVSLWIYNNSNTSQLFTFFSSANSSNVNFNYITPDANGTYRLVIDYSHPTFGTIGSDIFILTGAVLSLINLLPIAIPTLFMQFTGAVAIISTGLIFGGSSSGIGVFAVLLVAGGLSMFGFYPLTVGLGAVLALMVIVIRMARKK